MSVTSRWIRLPEPFPLKNHGFIYVGNNRWRLSPAFDINAQPRRTPQMETGISPLSGFIQISRPQSRPRSSSTSKAEDARRMVAEMGTLIAETWLATGIR